MISTQFKCILVITLMAYSAAAADITKYIAAEEIDWDVSPSGINKCTGAQFDSPAAFWTTDVLGSVYKKAQFIEYTDDSFTEKVSRPAEEQHLGLLGPIIRASPGDTITVTLMNRINIPLNMEPAGLTIVTSSEDSLPNGSPLGDVADPGGSAVYHWHVPSEAAPSEGEADTKMWLYRSSVYPEKSDNAGLLGPILITREGADLSSGRDIITVMQIIDEYASPYFEENLGGRDAASLGVSETELEESLLKHAINGYVFCNGPGLNMTQGEKVRWHVAAMGSEGDMHTSHWHGNTFLENGHRADQILLIPGSTHSVEMEVRAVGTWLLHCHVNDHIHAGMMALYTVLPPADGSNAVSVRDSVPADAPIRRYYVAAEAVPWDYAPLGGNGCLGAQQAALVQGGTSGTTTTGSSNTSSALPVTEWTDSELVFVGKEGGKIGSQYLKALFVEYTDANFTTQKVRPDSEAYLGLLGPIFKAEVGDRIEVVLRNKLTNGAAVTLHAHGIAYTKAAEGAPYNDGTNGSDRGDDGVPPAGTFTYVWQVPASAGPGPSDPSTIGWMYHSHKNEVADPYAGLVGALIIGRPGAFSRGGDGGGVIGNGTAAAVDVLGTASDVDKEAVVLFGVMNERASLMWPANKAILDGAAAAPAPATAVESGAAMEMGMVEEDMMHAINGYIYCNSPVPLTVAQGDTLRLHVIAIGTEVDLHSPSLMGATLQNGGQNGPALAVLPGVMVTADVAVEAPPGPAIMACRVADHIGAGMMSLVQINSKNGTEDVSISANSQQEEDAPATAASRTYFIAAEETVWNYTPLGKNNCGSSPQPFSDEASIFTEKYANTVGSKYTKALYKRYENAEFVRRVPVPAQHGMLGPLLAGEVGDVFDITFKNSLTTMSVNLHLDGGFVPLNGSANPAAPVDPGQTVQYKLYIPESTGPGPADASTIAYGYTSSVNLMTHPMAGLIGMALVGEKGAFSGYDAAAAMPAAPVPQGVDELIPLLAAITNENESPYLERNVQGLSIDVDALLAEGEAAAAAPTDEGSRRRHRRRRHLLDTTTTDAEAPAPAADGEAAAATTTTTDAEAEAGAATDATGTTSSADFIESNLKHALNGYLYCNMPDIQVQTGKKVRVSILTLGSDKDMHSIMFSGQTLMGGPAGSSRASVEPLMPAVTYTADMTPTEQGRWPINCIVHDHEEGGMSAILSVSDDGMGGGLSSSGGALSVWHMQCLMATVVAVALHLLLL